jgi:uncharacterized protein YceK
MPAQGDTTMRSVSNRRTGVAALLIAVMWLLGSSVPRSYARETDRYDRDRGGYVFATTRGVNEMDVHPALKVTILPVALILDLVFLPFALLADTVTR